jgi:general secretion pathway protein J
MLANKENGFTLIELLVSLAIFAVISVMAYGGLDYVLNTDRSTSTQMNRLSSLQKSMLLLQADVEQMRPRPIRDLYGTSQGAMISIADEPYRLLEWTRGGGQTYLKTQGSSLMRVAYGVRDNKLVRFQWPVLDQAPDSEPFVSEILENVARLQFRFLDSSLEWHNQWPPLNLNSGTAASPTLLPNAVEVTLELQDWGEVKRLFHGIF